MCASCETRSELEGGVDRAAQGLVSMAFGAFALGIVSVFFNPFFLAGIGAIASTAT